MGPSGAEVLTVGPSNVEVLTEKVLNLRLEERAAREAMVKVKLLGIITCLFNSTQQF